VIVATLGLAIGVNATIFSVLYGVLANVPLQYADPNALVVLWRPTTSRPDTARTCRATYLDWRERSRTFCRHWRLPVSRLPHLTGTGAETNAPERIASVDVFSPALMTVLGVQPAAGRIFTPEEERPGHEHLAILSHAAATSALAATALRWGSSCGSTASFRNHRRDAAVFNCPPAIRTWKCGRRSRWISARWPRGRIAWYKTIGRLAPDASIDGARAEMDASVARIAREHPGLECGVGRVAGPCARAGRRRHRTDAVGALHRGCPCLLIACANIANLLLARSAMVSREFRGARGVRAGRWVLVRRSITESVCWRCLAAWRGLVSPGSAFRALRPADSLHRAGADGIGLDSSVLLFTVAMTLGAGVLFGLVPAWRAMRPNLLQTLQDMRPQQHSSRRSRWLSDAMVVSEVANRADPRDCAGLLLRSFVAFDVGRSRLPHGERPSRSMSFCRTSVTEGAPPSASSFDEFLARIADGAGVHHGPRRVGVAHEPAWRAVRAGFQR
jgi:hypothetical protein